MGCVFSIHHGGRTDIQSGLPESGGTIKKVPVTIVMPYMADDGDWHLFYIYYFLSLLLSHKVDLVSIVLAKLEWHRKSYLVKSLSAVLCSGLLINIYGSRIKALNPDERYR